MQVVNYGKLTVNDGTRHDVQRHDVTQ